MILLCLRRVLPTTLQHSIALPLFWTSVLTAALFLYVLYPYSVFLKILVVHLFVFSFYFKHGWVPKIAWGCLGADKRTYFDMSMIEGGVGFDGGREK